MDSLALVQPLRITFLLLAIHCVSRLFECSQHLGVLCVRLVSWFVSLCPGCIVAPNLDDTLEALCHLIPVS